MGETATAAALSEARTPISTEVGRSSSTEGWGGEELPKQKIFSLRQAQASKPRISRHTNPTTHPTIRPTSHRGMPEAAGEGDGAGVGIGVSAEGHGPSLLTIPMDPLRKAAKEPPNA